MKRPVFFLAAALFLVTCALLALPHPLAWISGDTRGGGADMAAPRQCIRDQPKRGEPPLAGTSPRAHREHDRRRARFLRRVHVQHPETGAEPSGRLVGDGRNGARGDHVPGHDPRAHPPGHPDPIPPARPLPAGNRQSGTESGGGSGGRVADPGAASPASGCRRVHQRTSRAGRPRTMPPSGSGGACTRSSIGPMRRSPSYGPPTSRHDPSRVSCRPRGCTSTRRDGSRFGPAGSGAT